MSMIDWAENEIRIACEKERGSNAGNEWDYGCACYESALKAFKSLVEDEHSGMSISITKNILNSLIEGKSLTPIEDTYDIWNECGTLDNDGKQTYQCKRMSSLFKYVYQDGTVKYNDIYRTVFINATCDNTTWHGKLYDDIVDELFPITMPYSPKGSPYKVYGHTCTTLDNGKEIHVVGEYNTSYVDYIITPNGDKIELNRKYMETKNGYKIVC